MKSGKRPTRNQKKFLIQNSLNPANWLIVKNLSKEMLLIHKETGETKTINL